MDEQQGGKTVIEEQLKVLMDYTKFHIGLYTTLCTILVGVMGLDGLRGRVAPMLPYFLAALICFAIAGVFDGLIGSSLPYYRTWDGFIAAKLGPWFLPERFRIAAPVIASVEHTAFWIGTLIALWGVAKTFMATAPSPPYLLIRTSGGGGSKWSR
jgi:hypothetical protein